MKKIIIILCWLIPVVASAQKKKEVNFIKAENWKEVLEMARIQHKNIFIDAYATWCGPCKKMDAEVYTNNSVADYADTNFISVKIQIDRTEKDEGNIKRWYTDADFLRKQFQIETLPTYLFLSPEGKVMDRGEGYMPSSEFLALAIRANDPKQNFAYRIKQFNTNSIIGYPLLNLAMMAKSYHEDSLALQIAIKFKKTWLDQKEPSDIFNTELKNFIGSFPAIFHISDRIIVFMYKKPHIADGLLRQNGFSSGMTDYVIAKDEIYKLVKPNGNYLKTEPNWAELQKSIGKRYDSKLALRLIINAKIGWYTHKKDMETVARLYMERLDITGIDTAGIGRSTVNNIIWEVVFKYSNDVKTLKKALGYMTMLLTEMPEADTWLDTYANLLYKLGNKGEALIHEEKAIAIAQKRHDTIRIDEYRQAIDKMYKDEPTWSTNH